jgi:hypothetical protein
MCSYVPSNVHCQPFGDGISSRYNLLENGFLRIMVWLVAIFACFGNLLVLLGRSLLREDNQVHSFYIKNLSFADMIMGIYLIIIGYHDQKFRGNYLIEDEGWRSSVTCDTCGILSTLSNEASVLTLTLITLDRYISITFPLFRRRKSYKFALINVCTIWIASLFLSVIPVFVPEFFGNYFYKDNAVCVPFHLHRPWTKGWQYSAFLFLGLNMAAFTFICFAYITMFIAIKRSTKTVRSQFEKKERTLMKRFFFIVLTDFLCWMPIIIIKFIAISGKLSLKCFYLNHLFNFFLDTLKSNIHMTNLFHRGRSYTLRFHLCCRLNCKNLVKPVDKDITFFTYHFLKYICSIL